MQTKSTGSFLLKAALLALLSLVMVTFGACLASKRPELIPSSVREQVVGDKESNALDQATEIIRDRYYREVPGDQLSSKAIDAMTKSLKDPFTHYMDPKEYDEFLKDQSSSFEGVGVLIGKTKKGLKVGKVYNGSPAKQAGLKVGDVVTEADGVKLSKKTIKQATSRVKGPAGTSVRLTVVRGKGRAAKTLTIDSKRAAVNVPVVASRLIKKQGHKIGYALLGSFNEQATIQLASHLKKLADRGADRFILDLRGNPGGLVDQAQGVASIFLSGGEVVSLKGRKVSEIKYKAAKNALFPDQKLVVLVSEGTASAAEIVSGAVQDRGRGTIVGTHTYGKGVFQRIEPLVNGGALDITEGQYFTPKGRNLGGGGTKRGSGIKPDVVVKDIRKTAKVDEQLLKAISVVNGL